MNLEIRILCLPSANGLLGERTEFRETSCLYKGKLYLKAHEPQVGQLHEDVERKIPILPHF